MYAIRSYYDYYRQTAPLVDFYKRRGTLVAVDGEGRADEVWAVLRERMRGLIESGKA